MLLDIDYKLLAQQKISLLEFMKVSKFFDKKVENDLIGIINLIDAMEDKKISLVNSINNEIKEQEFNIEKRAVEVDFNKEDYAELYCSNIDHDDFLKYSQEDLENHNFDLGMYKAYKNILNKLK